METRSHQARRRVWLHLFAVGVALMALIPLAQPAQADTLTTCILTASGTICPNYPPPDLLNLNQPLYAATITQTASLQTLQTQAISNTIIGHGLAATDVDAVKSWGRADAQAELHGLLVKAVNTAAGSRPSTRRRGPAPSTSRTPSTGLARSRNARP
jgi:hypothetical protein